MKVVYPIFSFFYFFLIFLTILEVWEAKAVPNPCRQPTALPQEQGSDEQGPTGRVRRRTHADEPEMEAALGLRQGAPRPLASSL